MTSALLIVAALIQTIPVEVAPSIFGDAVREPPPPPSFAAEQRMTCFGKTLVVRNFGFTRPAGRRPSISVDGLPISGPGIDQVIADLGMSEAVYRFGGGCEPRPNRFSLYIYTIENDNDGGVIFRSGIAQIVNLRLRDYTGLHWIRHDGHWGELRRRSGR